jgi:hypothetical protein
MQLRVERVDPNALRRSRLDPAGWGQLAPPFNLLPSLLDFCQLHEFGQVILKKDLALHFTRKAFANHEEGISI